MDVLFLFILWILSCWAVGWLGNTRVIGYGWSVILAVFLTPIIALVIVLLSKKKKLLEKDLNTTKYLSNLFDLKEKGAINEKEYNKFKDNFLNKNKY
ncbi:hypothetical protein [Apibacter adventoris]|uniref:hypothetical protein n=1 Tax=Apibacter adventoris TaxID=1679466 RepID=UPI000CF6A7AD|nr:hypothetical protein [Apibacter adventoris]PQL92519.1 hypothetical protein C4S76_10615 [Apibacter adventoris]